MQGRVQGGLATLLLLVLAVILLPTQAAAHLYLVSSEPADAAHLGAVPGEIRLTFSEPLELAFTRVQLLGPDGNPVPLSEPTIPAGEPRVVVYRLEGAVGPGPYTVAWRTTSADGHPVNGSFRFSIDEDADGLAVAAAEESPAAAPVHHDPAVFPETEGFNAESPGYVAVRWVTFVGLLGVIGVVAFKLLVLGLVRRRRAPEGPALLEPATAKCAAFGLVFSPLLAAAVLARLYAQSLALHGPGEALNWAALSAILTRTTWGMGWLLQSAATVVVIVGFTIAWHRSRRYGHESNEARRSTYSAPSTRSRDAELSAAAYESGSTATATAIGVTAADTGTRRKQTVVRADSGMNVGWVLASLAALALAFTPALAGHAIMAPEYTWLALLSDGLHVLGAGGWLGSLLVVLIIGIPVAMRLGKERRGRAVALLVNAFSPTALFFAAIVTVTGVISASIHLGSLSDLWQSGYGRTLLLKLSMLSLVFGTGAYNWLRLRPALGGDEGARRLRRSAGFELAVGAAVLLVTAVLVATPPPMGVGSAAEHAVARESP